MMRHHRQLVAASILLLALLVSSIFFASCGTSTPATTASAKTKTGSISGTAAFDMIQKAADTYFASGKATKTIWAEDLYANLTDGNKTNDPNIISFRTATLYRAGHICSAVNIPLRSLFIDTLGWMTLPTDKTKPIVGYSETGNEGSEAVALLNIMGWDVTPLQWGFTSWYKCPVTAPGLFRPATQGGVGMNYPMETAPTVATATYDLPKFKYSGNNLTDLIKVAGNAWFTAEVPPPPDYRGTDAFFKDMFINPSKLFNWLASPVTTPFILDVRDASHYNLGHVAGAINIPITEVAKIENLHKLPPDRQIVVVDNDGMAAGQVVSVLNVLGYNATQIMWGMMGWTTNDNVVVHRFLEYEPGSDTKEHDIKEYPFCYVTDPGSYGQ
jgi:sulfur-carrier protein adenylyltransferase/sulfurtransferase